MMKSLSQDIYASLVRWAKENFSGLKGIHPDDQMKEFRTLFIKGENDSMSICDMMNNGYGKRKILRRL
ncbi:MAG: hypothetical protein ACLR8Y_20910 [Alistipes indistinctus]